MINNEMFTNRLQVIFDHYGLSASAFAEKLGVGRSSISHIVSGRNKPSLDFVLHILDNFDEVTFDWLILGKGNFPKNINTSQAPTLFQNKSEEKPKASEKDSNFIESNTIAKAFTGSETESNPKSASSIDRIIIFYTDNSFKEYKN